MVEMFLYIIQCLLFLNYNKSFLKIMKKKYLIVLLGFIATLVACNNKSSNKENDTLNSGSIKIAVDETFKPIIEEELQVFLAMNPEATIIPIFCDEVEAINLLMKDSVRFVVSSRTLTPSETDYFNKKKFYPQAIRIATDGLALIVNKENKDSLISTWQFKQILAGKITKWNQLGYSSCEKDINVVFDNPNSSTIHYVIDSICKGVPFSNNIKAMSNNKEVIEYVAKNVDAMGVVGANWVINSADSTNLSFINDVRIMSVSEEKIAETTNSYKPYQAYLALDRYPLLRNVYIILNDPKSGLPSGFSSFITGFRGQRIILKSGLLPAMAELRIVNVNEE